MAPGTDERGRIASDRAAPPHPDDTALAAALCRHETALARLRLALPSPSAAIIRELETAERALKEILARRDGAPR
ncbi:MAG: hypothetical protein WDN69_02285 [Aliidongia sp.]